VVDPDVSGSADAFQVKDSEVVASGSVPSSDPLVDEAGQVSAPELPALSRASVSPLLGGS